MADHSERVMSVEHPKHPKEWNAFRETDDFRYCLKTLSKQEGITSTNLVQKLTERFELYLEKRNALLTTAFNLMTSNQLPNTEKQIQQETAILDFVVLTNKWIRDFIKQWSTSKIAHNNALLTAVTFGHVEQAKQIVQYGMPNNIEPAIEQAFLSQDMEMVSVLFANKNKIRADVDYLAKAMELTKSAEFVGELSKSGLVRVFDSDRLHRFLRNPRASSSPSPPRARTPPKVQTPPRARTPPKAQTPSKAPSPPRARVHIDFAHSVFEDLGRLLKYDIHRGGPKSVVSEIQRLFDESTREGTLAKMWIRMATQYPTMSENGQENKRTAMTEATKTMFSKVYPLIQSSNDAKFAEQIIRESVI